MEMYFPQLKRWRKELAVSDDEAMKVNPALAGVKELIVQMADTLLIAYISSFFVTICYFFGEKGICLQNIS